MEIILDHAQPADDPVLFQSEIPLWNRMVAGQTLLHTFQIGFRRDAPFLVEPLRGSGQKFRLVFQTYDRTVHISICSFRF